MGHDNFSRFAGSQNFAVGPCDFDDDVFSRKVHSARRTFMRDETGVTATVAVRDTACERALDLPALMIIQPLGSHERDLDSRVAEVLPVALCMPRDQRKRRWIAEQHPRPPLANAFKKAVEPCSRHVKRGNKLAPQDSVAHEAQPVLRSNLDRGAPYHDLGITYVDPPPAQGAPLRGDVVADPVRAYEKSQRLPARAARAESLKPSASLRFQRLDVAAHNRLREKRNSRKLTQRIDRVRLKSMLAEQIAVVRGERLCVLQQRPQALDPQALDPLARPPLRLLKRRANRDCGVPFEPLVNRKDNR